MHPLRSILAVAIALASLALQAETHKETLVPAPGKAITLDLPLNLSATVAASGIRRVRFFAKAPDGRIVATSMYNLADNTRGAIYILDGWDEKLHTFAKITPYLTHLRNPNNIAFYTDAQKKSWIYIPLTDRLVRYEFHPGDEKPSSPEQVLMRFPDYGSNYKYGGWHLTRTVAVATLHGRTRVYVAVGSSCNYCRELEAQRASVIAMDPDGSHAEIVATGLRNAVDLRYVPEVDGGALFATNMGEDHLGDALPEDTFFELDSNDHPGPLAQSPAPNYGWPTCYFANGKPVHDATPLPDGPEHVAGAQDASDSIYGKQNGMAKAGTNLAAVARVTPNLPKLGAPPAPLARCDKVPPAYTTFSAHSSPLGLSSMNGAFLVALHGAGHPRVGSGYRVVRFTPTDRKPQDFITGFLTRDGTGKAVVHGRPCGILQITERTFLLSDDYNGAVYAIFSHQ